ncbi:hypothetical protein [Sphingomonas hengshuiensis]|nr:hypothetical protein [Sphingomonas hengshuiensis]
MVTHTDIRRECPAEVTAPLPPRIVAGADVQIAALPATLGYLAARFRREALLEARLIDAAGQCPK